MLLRPNTLPFFKVNSAVCGANDDVFTHCQSHQADSEVELGVVIGKAAKYVSKDEGIRHVFGCCTVNDI